MCDLPFLWSFLWMKYLMRDSHFHFFSCEVFKWNWICKLWRHIRSMVCCASCVNKMQWKSLDEREYIRQVAVVRYGCKLLPLWSYHLSFRNKTHVIGMMWISNIWEISVSIVLLYTHVLHLNIAEKFTLLQIWLKYFLCRLNFFWSCL